MFMQQTHNRSVLNPGATGKGGDVNMALSLRQQWIGFPGASTQMLNGSGFVKDIRSGFGFMFLNDELGPHKSQNLKINYAYFIPFAEKAFLSLGLGMGFIHNEYDESDFFAMDDNDDVITYERLTKTVPDFDFGMEFNTSNLEVGASVTHFSYAYEDVNLVRPMRNIYAYVRGKVPLDKYWDFIPGFTWHNTRQLNTYEVNASLRYNNNICVNIIYRNPASLGIAAGINIYGGFRIVYSYDYGFDGLSRYNNGSHEITLSYNIPVNTTYVRSKLRFFRWKMF
jgi:type IX secretion system PorP/SprF family membrane protein